MSRADLSVPMLLKQQELMVTLAILSPSPSSSTLAIPIQRFSSSHLHQALPPADLPFPIQCILNSSGRRRPEKCQVLSSQGTDGSVCPHPFQNGSQWQKLTSAAMSVDPAPSVILSPPSPRSQQRTFFFSHSCNCL